MAAYKIFFRKSVQKDFEAIPKKDLQRILKRIQGLANDPRPPGSEKLTGQERYRLRQQEQAQQRILMFQGYFPPIVLVHL